MKFLSLLLCTSLFLGSAPSVLAETDKELENALLQVKSRIEISDYENFNSNIYKNDKSETVYSFAWDNSAEEDYEYLNIVYSDGFIQSYTHGFDQVYDNDNKFPAVSVSEAEDIALEFINRINPKQAQNIKIVNNLSANIYGTGYHFDLVRFEQGFPVRNETGSIRIHKSDGRVMEFYMQYDTEVEFPVVGEPISNDDAMMLYKQNLAPKLQYSSYFNYKTNELEIFAEYVSNEGKMRINALDGSIYTLPENNEHYKFAIQESASADMAVNGSGGLSRAEIENIEKISGLISNEKAELIARECDIISIPEKALLENISLNSIYNDNSKYYYSMDFKYEDKYTSVSVDAKTGEIIGFYKEPEYNPGKKEHDKETELAVAQDAFLKLSPEKYKKYKLQSNENGSVNYIRLENGIEVSFDIAWFGFDYNGELISYSLSYTENGEFDSVDSVLTSDEICDNIFKQLKFSPMFVIDSKTNSASLFYTVMKNWCETSFTVNPYTAEYINYKGESIKLDESVPIVYSDIENHYAKEKFEKLAEFGIGFNGEMLYADKTISQKEFYELLGKAFYNTNEYEYVLQRLKENGVTESFEIDKDEALTREDAAIMFIRIIGAEEYAKFNDIYVSPFSDVTENKGYIALLKALNVVSGTPDGCFNPGNNITRAEALIMLYNYFNR